MSTTKPEGYDSVAVANRFIEFARSQGKDIRSISKLTKLVYIAHGYLLAVEDRPLVKDKVEAWPYGPVIPHLYNTFRRTPPVPEPLQPKQVESCNEFDDDTVQSFIEQVYRSYGRFSLDDLSQITHRKGSPWDKVYRDGLGKNGQIDNDVTQQYYYDLIESD